MRLSRCTTLRQIPVKRENVGTKNAIIKLYKENQITDNEAVTKINEYKKKTTSLNTLLYHQVIDDQIQML
ncbi:MAG: hypothetical protein ACKPKO_20450 [Candidatus Fonsibacter sp.]